MKAPYDKAIDLYDVNIGDVIPYENNPRKNEGAVKFVMNTIKEVGYINPIIVDEDMVILAGHTRWTALKRMSWAKVPHVKQIFGLSDEKKKLYRLADNSSGEAAEWDQTKLAEEVKALKELYKLTDFYIKAPTEADIADEKFNDTNAEYPLVPQFSEKYDAIIVMFKNDIDFNNFKEKIGMEKVKSYKNTQTGECRVVWYERMMECLKK